MRLHVLAIALLSWSISMPTLAANKGSTSATERSADTAVAKQFKGLDCQYVVDADQMELELTGKDEF